MPGKSQLLEDPTEVNLSLNPGVPQPPTSHLFSTPTTTEGQEGNMLLYPPQKRYRTLEKILSAYLHFTQKCLLPLCTQTRILPIQIILPGVILTESRKSHSFLYS